MSENLKFVFTVDKTTNTVNVLREFNAELKLVWAAWSNPEILDKWWAPKPWRAESKSMNFTEGGYWLYAMVSPENEKHWGRQDYLKIDTFESFSGTDSFCDEKGTLNPELPKTLFENSFSEKDGKTLVKVISKYENLEMLEKVIQMGFKEGFTMALENLDQYLSSQFQLRQQNKNCNQARVCTYLNFDGKTEEAFLFYKKVFKSEFIGKGIQRFGEIPENSENPPIPESIKKMILHIELPITGNHILMGTDAPKEMGFNLAKGNNMHICIEPESRTEADRLFNELSVGGNVTMPMADMFFGAYFGEFSDKYGINWMINFQNK